MIRDVIEQLKRDENYHGQITYIREITQDSALSEHFPENLSQQLVENLKRLGIYKLYIHQGEAYRRISSGENVIISTSTSSGKTLAFVVPVLDTLLRDPRATSLFLYPTKALTADQFEKFSEMTRGLNIKCGVYDGDTPSDERSFLRRTSRVLFANPDILHVGILPNHANWSKFLSNLRFVVIDEAHYFSGVIGSHLSAVLRRLRRIAHYYGAFPQFIISSATLGNPEEFSFKLVGERFTTIANDNVYLRRKYFIVFNPELIQKDLNLRKSIYKEAIWVIRTLLRLGLKVIVFVKSRQGVELVTNTLRQSLNEEEKGLVSSYRAGYTRDTRHQIEKEFKEGSLKVIVTTNALELGIDIGDLDATIIVGYPGSLSSLYQQSGRSGRKNESLTIFMANSDSLDQYIVNNPDFIFSKRFDALEINNENPYILFPHILCAAYELPIEEETDVEYFGNEIRNQVRRMKQEGLLSEKGNKYFYTDRVSYAPKVSIRSTGEENFKLVDENDNILERISWKRAIEEAYEGAVYLHLAKTYVVRKLDLEARIAYLKQQETEYYTDSLAIESIEIVNMKTQKQYKDFEIYYGDVLVTEIVRGYVKKQFITDRRIGTEPLELPRITFYTKALWFPIEKNYSMLLKAANADLVGSIHALEHLLIGVMGAIVACDRKDVGGVSHPLHPDTAMPTIFVYDGVEGGIGISEKAFEKIEDLFSVSYNTISKCQCRDGCPSCIFSPKCGNENKPLSKNGAILLLEEFTK